MALKAMDGAMAEVTDELRNTMYFDARALYCLKELSSFLFDRVIMAFAFNTMANGDACSVTIVRELLVTLNNILVSLKNIPPKPLLESLFVFLLQEKSGEKNFNINNELRALLSRAENALGVVREFNRQVPLTMILRCASRNMSLSPREISGGEDWFVIYREYWKDRVEAAFSDYSRNRRRREVLDSFHSFLNVTNLRLLLYAAADASSDGIPVRGAFSLSFLLTFYPVIFIPDIKDALQTVFVDGDFVRKENHVEFDEAYNNLMKLEDEIRKFEARLSPSGLYGERYEQANQDMASLPAKRRKFQIVVEEASAEALEIVDLAKRSSQSMINILGGIAVADPNGKHGSLSNLQKLSDKDPEFVNSITGIIRTFQNLIRILDDIDAMDIPK
jgi:hypothetical protein